MEKQLDANWVSIESAARATGVSSSSIRAWCAAGVVRSIARTSGRVVDLAAVRLHGMPASTAPEAINARLADRDIVLKSAMAEAGPALNDAILELQDLARDRLDD